MKTAPPSFFLLPDWELWYFRN